MINFVWNFKDFYSLNCSQGTILFNPFTTGDPPGRSYQGRPISLEREGIRNFRSIFLKVG